MVQTLPAPAEYELSFAGRFESSVNNSAGKHKIDFGGRPRAAGDANIPRVKKFRGAADIYHRGKIGLLNEIKADGAAGCDFALRDNGRVVRSNVTLQIDMRLKCDRANMAVRASSYIVTADIRLVFWNKI